MSATPQRMIALILTVVVASVLAGAAFVLDPPGLQRQRRLDERRIHDLDRLSDEVNAWYGAHKHLPPDVKALVAGRTAPISTSDPVSYAPYEYLPHEHGQYHLCAVFATEAGSTYRLGIEARHGKGRHCFALDAAER